MTPEQQEQARRFVAWAGWEWQQRMEAIGPEGRFVVAGFPRGDHLGDRRVREWPAAACIPGLAAELDACLALALDLARARVADNAREVERLRDERARLRRKVEAMERRAGEGKAA